MSLNYSYKHDISYTNYNNKNLPWKVNTSYIYHNNQTINSSLKLGAIKNNLVIESSQNDIMLITPQNNKKVIAKNSVTINNNLDISNILKANFINAKDLSLTGLLHTGNLTIIGNMDLLGTFTYQGGTSIGDISESETRFRGVNFVNNSMFYDVSIINTELFLSDFSNMNIFNSQIYNIPIGYTISNNSAPAKAVFSDVSLYTLVLDSSLNSKRYIKFSNSNSNSNIIIKSSDDYSKLEISKPLNLNVGFSFEQAVTNISNINVFHGDISCVTLYYSHLVPDVKLNNYFDVSIGQVSVSGTIIPSVNNRFNIGSSNYNFNEINSNRFIGDLSGRVPYAYNLRKNLDMSFNSLDIYGTFTLQGNNLNQFLSSELNSISKGTTDFSNVNKRVRDLSISLYSKADFDLCLNANFTKISLHDASLLVQNNWITSISNSVYSKSEFDLSLNRNLLRINDVSAINDVVTYPARIYPRLGYIDNSLNKVTNAKVSNELVFPYAITYVDDNVEDTNIKESYSYRKTTTRYTITTSTKYIATATTVANYYSGAVPQRQPNDVNLTRAVMVYVNGDNALTPSRNRTWSNTNASNTLPAVYLTVKLASPRVVSYQINTSWLTWEQHRINAQQVRGRYLATILSSAEQTAAANAKAGYDNVWIGGRRKSSYQVTTTNTGGTITTSGSYAIHSFTTVGSNTFTVNASVSIDYLVVAGGGSGGAGRGGGGGAGGVRTGTTTLAAGSYNITVGAGGDRVFSNFPGKDGGSSSIGSSFGSGTIGDWSLGTPPQANSWNSVCWSPQRNIFVAVAWNTTASHRVMHSANGIDWFLASGAAAYAWYSVVWSPSLVRFVAIAIYQLNGIMYSTDGISWALGTCPAGEWRRACWSPQRNRFVAVGKNGAIVMYSDDGITWSNSGISGAPAFTWLGVCWAAEAQDGIYVAVAEQGKVMISSNGTSWAEQTNVINNLWWNVCWSPQLARFVAVADRGTFNVMYSGDGSNWTGASGPFGCNDVCWSPEAGSFMALAFSGRKMTSKDGISWTEMGSSTVPNGGCSICWSPGVNRFVAVGTNAVMSALLSTLISTTGGGGGGGWDNTRGRAGGSGGGSSAGGTFSGGASINGEGYAGAARYDGSIGGGGGGAGDAASGEDGAIGISSTLTGTTRYYAGGGGGGNCLENTNAGVAYGGTYRGSNGTYGGGNGSNFNSSTANRYQWTYNAWTDDASTELDSNATYTVAVTLGNTIPCTVNGVPFQANALSGPNFSIGGDIHYYSGASTGNISGTGLALAHNFLYGGDPRTLTLKNLIYGATYKTSFFSVGFDSNTELIKQRFVATNVSLAEINPTIYGLHRGIVINVTFIANNTGTQIFTIEPLNRDAVNGVYTFHWNAFANRLVSTTSPPSEPYTDAVANTGGGGGGNDPGYGLPSGAGGSGIVIIRYLLNSANNKSSDAWEWHNGDTWGNYENFATNEPNTITQTNTIMFSTNKWDDQFGSYTFPALYMTYQLQSITSSDYEGNTSLMTWDNHKTQAQTVRNRFMATIENSSQNTWVADCISAMSISDIYKNGTGVYIGAMRTSGSSASGFSASDWQWSDGATWSYSNFYRQGETQLYPDGTTTTTYSAYIPQQPTRVTSSAPEGQQPITIDASNIKLPILVSSITGSITATSCVIGALNLPASTTSNMTIGNPNSSAITTAPNNNKEYTTTITTYTTTDTYAYNGTTLVISGRTATGGNNIDLTTDNLYRIHRFTSTGTFTPSFNGTVEVLLVGGGGGGGSSLGGGGGGGSVIYMPNVTVNAGQNYTIEVGTGGPSGNPGLPSKAFTAIADGGGSSGTYPTGNGTSGGSGGGAAATETRINLGGGVSTVSTLGSNSGTIYGNRGGHMTTTRAGGVPTRAAGGGGAGGQGLDTNPTIRGVDLNSNLTGDTGQTGAGSGGVGIINNILGTSFYWGGGGGGGAYEGQCGGYGGFGGGGGGAGNSGLGMGGINAYTNGSNGSAGYGVNGGAGGAYTGGGGGGGSWEGGQGGRGGDGIVIIRYLLEQPIGSFKITDNSNNNSNYVKSSASALPTTIPTNYSCIAISDDGMFVALGKASEVTVYMRNSSTSGWTTIGSPISVNFTAYTGTGVGIIPTQFTENWRKNLKNLAINFNYNTGSSTSQLLLAFGDTINIIKVYSYSNGNWTFPNGFYSVAGGSWGNNTLTSYSATTLGVSATTNFGYFVTLSQSPSVLGFTVADRFYTYNCTTTNNSIRGSAKTLPISFSNATKNIVAFKMSSDADKIIVSNTHYVFIYKWINTDFSNINTISYLASDITFNYGSFTSISAAPRSLDISNISSINNDCVFAIGFPDVIIDVTNNKKSRGYVEYWKLVNNTLTRLITLLPRKRDFNNSSIDNDEYFFSAGGIKITNANTILVAPNFKFHFNSTNKKYELDIRSDTWTAHNNRSTGSRLFASIQNEVENELVKISARNNNSVWIGGKRVAIPINASGKTSIDWEWITPDPWIYQNFAINQPDNTNERGVRFRSDGWSNWSPNNISQAIFMTLPVQYPLKNTFTIFDNRFYFHSSGFSSTYSPNNLSSTVIARWYSLSTSTTPTNSNTINFSADGRIVSNSKGVLTPSDIRLKENIVDTTPKLADLLKVRVVNYNLKGSDGKKLIGVIAQELEQLFPSLVKDGELSHYDINHGKTESYKSVKYSCFDIILIKAFQEQMAIINKLSSQLDEIEGKTKILKAISEDITILNEELALLKSENELFKLNINEILKLI